jgi:hypothetical protein
MTITFLLMMTGNVLHADPIKLFGIDWSMSYDEMKTVAEDRGYNCDTEKFIKVIYCQKGKEGTDYIAINTDRKVVFFNCNVFNGCKYSAEQIKDMIIKEGIAFLFIPEEIRVGTSLLDDVTPIYRTAYRADGENGDYVIVFPLFDRYNARFNNKPGIILGKGTLGNKVNLN